MWSNWSATWELVPEALDWTAMICPISLDPFGISVPSEVLMAVWVLTTMLSPVLAVFESSLLSSSPLTGLIGDCGAAAGAWAAGCAAGGFCWGLLAGLAGCVAGDG